MFYMVTVNVDPYCSDELPILFFKNNPTKAEVWEELKKEHFYQVNKDDQPNSEDWDWDFEATQVNATSIINNIGAL